MVDEAEEEAEEDGEPEADKLAPGASAKKRRRFRAAISRSRYRARKLPCTGRCKAGARSLGRGKTLRSAEMLTCWR